MHVSTVNPATDTPTAPVAALRARAESLRTQSTDLIDPLAIAYRRRATELELQAWAIEATVWITPA